MDMKAIVGSVRSGRRGALAGLLAGTAALLDSAGTEAGKRRCRHCPNRTCCVCSSSTANPGCRFGPAVTATQDTEAICNMVCGISEWSMANYNFIEGEMTTPCSSEHTQCIEVGCPLC
jgi:hypothetical protein